MTIINWKVYLINKDNVTNDEINLIQLVLESLERDGIEDYPYKDNYTPLLDLTKDKEDSFDIILVCNNQTIKQKIKECMQQSHFNKHIILNSDEAVTHILNH